MKQLGTLLLLFFILLSCNEGNKKSYKPGSLGSINSLAVVMDTELWEGVVGDKVREHFAAPIVGLTWDEPVFSIDHMPKQVFTTTTRHRRAVLFVDIDTLNIAHIKTDLYATPQKVAVIKGSTQEELLANLDAAAETMIASIKEMELKESQKRFLRSLNKDTIMETKFGVSLRLPSLYTVDKQEDNFVWIARDIQKGSMNIIAYDIPWDSLTNDTTFVNDFISMRDSIGKKYIPGPDLPNKVTYMTTEDAFAPHVFAAELDERETIEVRSIWDMENYPMAGPFVTYIIDDKDNNRKLVLEAFCFAPATNKRDYMFELEAILRTVKFK